jgi:hypothetical protein
MENNEALEKLCDMLLKKFTATQILSVLKQCGVYGMLTVRGFTIGTLITDDKYREITKRLKLIEENLYGTN